MTTSTFPLYKHFNPVLSTIRENVIEEPPVVSHNDSSSLSSSVDGYVYRLCASLFQNKRYQRGGFTNNRPPMSNVQNIPSPSKWEGFVAFFKRHPLKIALTCAVTAIGLYCLMEHPYNHILIDRADPNRVMAGDIHHFDEIDGLTQLNGISIEEIERRARPGMWSGSGFLGANQSLKEALKKDWKTVCALGLTHTEIGGHLKAILARSDYLLDQDLDEDSDEFTYDFSTLPGNTMNRGSPIQTFRLSDSSALGIQNDIFDEPGCFNMSLDFEIDGSKTIKYCGTDSQFGKDSTLTNVETKKSVFFEKKLMNYVQKFGFYEGEDEGVPNKYRTDPLQAVEVLTGLKYSTLEKIVKASHGC